MQQYPWEWSINMHQRMIPKHKKQTTYDVHVTQHIPQKVAIGMTSQQFKSPGNRAGRSIRAHSMTSSPPLGFVFASSCNLLLISGGKNFPLAFAVSVSNIYSEVQLFIPHGGNPQKGPPGEKHNSSQGIRKCLFNKHQPLGKFSCLETYFSSKIITPRLIPKFSGSAAPASFLKKPPPTSKKSHWSKDKILSFHPG